MGGWIAYWNSDNSIYVNARHRDIHYRAIAQDIGAYVQPDAVVLDYGCGESLHADIVAAKAARLVLCEAAETVRASLATRFFEVANITVATPDDVAAMPKQSFDLIVMHSVAQYLTTDELDILLARFHGLLEPNGLFILGDVIPPNVSALTDAAALLRFAAANGFFVAALAGLVRTAFSDYRRLRRTLGLSGYDEAAITAKLTAAGYRATRAPTNLGHNPARMTFLAKPI